MVLRDPTGVQRRRIRIQGIVQGVGFRPFVYGQALRLGLGGFVLNSTAGVTIEVEGEPQKLDAFLAALQEQPPPLARIDDLTVEALPSCGDTVFVIAQSRAESSRSTLISPDVATCNDCLRELNDPADRHFRYPFTNCTNCGPRFTIIQALPYDREKTTMRSFPLCSVCRVEYEDPLDRRFHAQPVACPICGPRVRMLDAAKRELEGPEALIEAARLLANGAIVALKGLGGYHLACDALHAETVTLLRQRKRREAKPFALMVRDLEAARQLCEVDEAEAALLCSRQRPIVLLRRRPGVPVAPDVAPGIATLGLMLPYTPLHYLLLEIFADLCRPGRPAVLVMTSGNLSDEPIICCDEEARGLLDSVADALLTHNRAIQRRCDDSVARIIAGDEQLFRRSRGYAPEPMRLAFEAPVPILACGGQLKNTFCLATGRQAFLSQHIGDLESLESLTVFRETIDAFQRLFDIHPQAVVYDLHPDYLATQEALAMDVPHKIGVQHHHAHIASVLAEHGLAGQVIGVAADGTGYGTDSAVWGCEIMVADCCNFERLAHLAYVSLPGGEQAIRQPWRMAAVYLAQAYGNSFLELDIPFVRQLDHQRWRPLAQMIARGLNSPSASSLGRLFDAVAALLGICDVAQYEGQAAIELEMLAGDAEMVYPFAITGERPATLDVMPLIRALVEDLHRGLPAPQIAGRFHRSITELLASACLHVRQQTGLSTVALSGGVFQNRLLLEQLAVRLEALGFDVYFNRRVPPNDGGLSLGQAAVAAARLNAEML